MTRQPGQEPSRSPTHRVPLSGAVLTASGLALALIVWLAPHPVGWTLIGLPVLLILPGLAALLALDQDRTPRLRRLPMSVAISLALNVLIVLMLQVGGLSLSRQTVLGSVLVFLLVVGLFLARRAPFRGLGGHGVQLQRLIHRSRPLLAFLFAALSLLCAVILAARLIPRQGTRTEAPTFFFADPQQALREFQAAPAGHSVDLDVITVRPSTDSARYAVAADVDGHPVASAILRGDPSVSTTLAAPIPTGSCSHQLRIMLFRGADRTPSRTLGLYREQVRGTHCQPRTIS